MPIVNMRRPAIVAIATIADGPRPVAQATIRFIARSTERRPARFKGAAKKARRRPRWRG